ncbi:MAG: GNAT family N-acetyltransferase [Treponema sp.]|nr:GNAT family N-acetyltransferase [Treponema sp.]
MKDVYEEVPEFENEHYLFRFVKESDASDLLEVYSDKNALPFFNSDNCHGDNFYYPTIERMKEAIAFWIKSYETKWFVRWAIVEKQSGKAIGTVELFHRDANDYFNNIALLRLDLKSSHEKADVIEEVSSLILPAVYEMFNAEKIITKVPLYAIERMAAFKKLGFAKSEEFLVGTSDGYSYKDYWEKQR